jgi:hypothetical protein
MENSRKLLAITRELGRSGLESSRKLSSAEDADTDIEVV